MIRTMFRWVARWTIRSAVVAGVVALVVRLVRRDEGAPEAPEGGGPTTASAPTTTAPAEQPSAASPTEAATWVAPEAGTCPASHPVKVKESSGIFHVPGGLAYDRTTPDRCYVDAAAAEADGFRQAKR